jgi:hypothetical protein
MFRTLAPPQNLWASVLPELARGLPPDLARLETWLEDPRFYEPFRPYFHPREGRPSVPMETYVRMMVLKLRCGYGYERLGAEVADSISWRLFCRVPFGAPVPHPSTLEKTTSRCGQAAVAQLNDGLVDKAAVEAGVLVVERWVLAPFRKHTFFSLAELNRAIKQKVAELPERPFRGEPTSRRELFGPVKTTCSCKSRRRWPHAATGWSALLRRLASLPVGGGPSPSSALSSSS